MNDDDVLEAAPDAGGPDWVLLETLGTEAEAMIIVGFLRSAGIEAEMESLVFHQEPVNFGGLGEVKVRVPADRLDEARQALAQRDTDAAGGLELAEGESVPPEDASENAPERTGGEGTEPA